MLFLGIQFPFFQLMMTLLVVSVFIISVMNTVLNISVVTEADAPRPAAGRPRVEDAGPEMLAMNGGKEMD